MFRRPATHYQLVAEYLPLKQGLKLLSYDVYFAYFTVAEYLPLKQGLKHVYPRLLSLPQIHVAEYLPLKQGLKRFTLRICCAARAWGCRVPSTKTRIETGATGATTEFDAGVAEYLPLKQGLKREEIVNRHNPDKCCRVPSTKTRIETS